MKKLTLCGLILLSLAACDNNKNTMTCGKYEVGITMSEDGASITAVINGDEMTLNQAISASGARYVGELNDTTVTLWNKGENWTMYLNEDEMIECKR